MLEFILVSEKEIENHASHLAADNVWKKILGRHSLRFQLGLKAALWQSKLNKVEEQQKCERENNQLPTLQKQKYKHAPGKMPPKGQA